MSHYNVYVAVAPFEDLDELLAPYDESLEVEPYIYRTKAELIEEQKMFQREFAKRENCEELKGKYPKLMAAKTDEEFYAEAICDDTDYDEDGNELSTYNPNSKWDWYEVGGRWSGDILLKNGKKADSAMKSEINFSVPEKVIKENSDFWNIWVEGKTNLSEEKIKERFGLFLMKPEYYKKIYGNKETYLKSVSINAPFAFLSSKTGWLEKGKMGWFGVSNETPEERLNWELNFGNILKEIPDDYEIFCVDCHI